MSFALQVDSNADKKTLYQTLLEQAQALMAGENDRIANAANFSALVYHGLPKLNWAGFYFFDGKELVVGPFQGLPACVRIPPGKGVCGTAFVTGQTQVVDDVLAFPGHIACDAASRSEIVVPIMSAGTLIGVFDVDSPIAARFDDQDAAGMERLVEQFSSTLTP